MLDDSGDAVTPCGVFKKIKRPLRRAVDQHVASEQNDWDFPVSACF